MNAQLFGANAAKNDIAEIACPSANAAVMVMMISLVEIVPAWKHVRDVISWCAKAASRTMRICMTSPRAAGSAQKAYVQVANNPKVKSHMKNVKDGVRH